MQINKSTLPFLRAFYQISSKRVKENTNHLLAQRSYYILVFVALKTFCFTTEFANGFRKYWITCCHRSNVIVTLSQCLLKGTFPQKCIISSVLATDTFLV